MKPEKEHRIEFYSKGDGASGFHLQTAEPILKNFDNEKEYKINDIPT